MFKINIKDVIRYTKCPMYYKLHSNPIINANRAEMHDKYEHDLFTVLYTYLIRLQSGENVRVDNLTTNFMKLWTNGRYKRTEANFLYNNPYSNNDVIEIRRKSGLEALIFLHQYFKKNRIYPILINEPYEVKISKNVILKGNIPLLYQNSDGVIELLHFLVDDKYDKSFTIEKDLGLTASLLGCQTISGKRIDKISVYSFHKKKIYTTVRDYKDMDVFKKIVLNVSKCIYNNILYPCINYKCGDCIYNDICLKDYGIINT